MSQSHLELDPPPALPSPETLHNIMLRVQAHAMAMIDLANHRKDVQKGDPKVGGHATASSSALHLLSTLHLVSKNPQDFIACKPHASPIDHTNNYLLRLFAEKDHTTRMDDERARVAMRNLRHFSTKEPTFQSYHSAFDPDHFGYLPSGSVGIPPVMAAYLAHAYRMAYMHGYKVPADAHFWCIMGDSEYREGSLMEVLPEISERGLGHVTWILDYNRQSLDGHRILNEAAMGGKDNDRVEKTALANGWDVIQLRHGKFRQEIFNANPVGEALQNVIENAMPDYEFQSLLSKCDPRTTVEAMGKYDKGAQSALSSLDENDVLRFLTDLGGHDVDLLTDAYASARRDPEKPVLVVAHTIKGWNLKIAAHSNNHSALPSREEIVELRKSSGLKGGDLTDFERFDEGTEEDNYLKARGDWLWQGRDACLNLRNQNLDNVAEEMRMTGAAAEYPTDSAINLKLVPLVHTQWMLGQISAKMSRLADTPFEDSQVQAPQKPLTPVEKKLKTAANYLITLAPDVGTSTNLNASMDGRIFGPETEDFENDYGVKDSKSPDIVPHESGHSRFVRFDIAEGNAMSCAMSYGKMAELTGVPFIPIMTVYDFFIKRALDQLFYGLYWQSSFIVVGTPSGVTLSPEGAQHAWKSDIQIANAICWEPAYALELDWILTESIRRHLITAVEGHDSPNGNIGRTGVVVRGVTRSLEQKEMLKRLKAHQRFQGQSDEDILETTRKDCLEGGYYLVDYRGLPDYRPSENVVHIFSMGALITEALAASDELLKTGIYANVIQVSSTDLLLGNLAEHNKYHHLRVGLGISGDLYLAPRVGLDAKTAAYPPAFFGPRPKTHFGADLGSQVQFQTLAGRRIPVVSVHDGEPGLLDNIGSIVGTLQRSLAVRHHSKSGRPVDIYEYHGIDRGSVVKACQEVMDESAITPLQVAQAGSDAGALDPASAFAPKGSKSIRGQA